MKKSLSKEDINTHADESHIDYAEVYRLQEKKQLEKRLKKTRNVLFLSSITVLGGASVFWIMTNTLFTYKNFLIYLVLSIILALLALFSKKRPYLALLTALILCIAVSAVEVILNKTDDLLVEGTIHKLFIITLLVFSLPSSKEAELIRKELKFS